MNRTIISFLISFVLLIVVIAINRITHNKARNYYSQAERSRDIIKSYEKLATQVRSAEIFTPTMLASDAAELYQLYLKDIDSIQNNLSYLRNIIKDNPEQAKLTDSLSNILGIQLPVLRNKNIPELVAEGQAYRVKSLLQLHSLIAQGQTIEERQLEKRKQELLTSSGTNNFFSLLLAILAIIIVSSTFISHVFINKKNVWLEGFLESILNTSQNGIIYYKAVRKNGVIVDFKIEFANNAIAYLLGLEPKTIIGKTLTQLGSSMKNARLVGIYMKAVETGEPVQFEHLHFYNNIEKWLYLSISKMNDGITVAHHDISALKGYENDLKKNIEALEQSNKELEEYAYAASHDLQEPLRKLRTFGGFLQELQHDRLDEKGKQHLDKMLKAAERMTLLIKDLLTFSSLKQKDAFELTDLDEILENVLQDLEVLIAQKEAIISQDKLPEIEAIPVQINQLFYNLVNNSLKFAREDIPLHLDISCRLLTGDEVERITGLIKGRSYYEIVFSDNGIGFDADYAHHIFGMFKRLNDKNIYAGSGIGLALCKKVVINHGGQIEATGKENVGAQFYIYLPSVQMTN